MSDPVCDICGKPGTSMFYPAGLGWQTKPTVWYCDSHNPFSSGEVARLTTERDEWMRRADRAEARFPQQNAALVAEVLRLRTDLAAARAALMQTVSALDILMGDTDLVEDDSVEFRACQHGSFVLKRLGTGEALQAVREAQKMFKQVWKFDHSNEVTHFAQEGLARLKAVFGE